MSKREREQEGQHIPAGGEQNKKRRRTTREEKPKDPLYKAILSTTASNDNASSVDDATLLKIKKCLDRGRHSNTSEHEAKTAIFIATEYMRKHNITMAQLLEREQASERSKRGGQCVVSIKRTDGDFAKPVRTEGHLGTLAAAIQVFFDCKSYTVTRIAVLEVHFYGILINANAAANAFEMAYNLIGRWALSHKGNGPRLSYCCGVSDELYARAKREQRLEEAQAKQAELETRLKQEGSEELQSAPVRMLHDTLDDTETADSTTFLDMDYADKENNLSSDDGSECDVDYFQPTFKIESDNDIDIDQELDRAIEASVKQEHHSPINDGDLHHRPFSSSDALSVEQKYQSPINDEAIKQEPGAEKSSTAIWTSSSQLVLFRKTAEAIADEYLKSTGLKLKNSTHRRRVADHQAYIEGKKDSHKIDIRNNAKRIESA